MSRPRLITGLLLAVLAFALLLTAVAFAGTAAFLFLRGSGQDAYAAIMTAVFMSLPVCIVTIVALTRAQPASVPQQAAKAIPVATDASMNATLVNLASHHPLMAICCAAAIGFANARSRAP